MRALRIERKLSRFAAARVASAFGSGRGAQVGPLRLVEVAAPHPPSADWYPVAPVLSGICGSDLASVDGRSSLYFEDIVSFPFILGHEVLGTMAADGVAADGSTLAAGQRVVIQPVLGCAARGLDLCDACRAGDVGRCGCLSHGHLAPGLQTGFCHETGGGWSDGHLVAHSSQLFAVPDSLSDEDAVTVEPMACAIHAALRAQASSDDTVAIIGAGTLGLGVLAALRFLSDTGRSSSPDQVLIGARYPVQRQMATALGADQVVDPRHLDRAVRSATASLVVGRPSGQPGVLSGGADVTIDCVGSAESIAEALRITRPGGRVVLVGMPSKVSIDLAPLWHREIELVGAYAYGTETIATESEVTFALAIEMAGTLGTGRLVSAAYSLDRYEEALAHAGSAGPRGAIKIVFDVRPKRAATQRED
jgi:threonine dehydrogenase-like Zn-dependent dehydrogenase